MRREHFIATLDPPPVDIVPSSFADKLSTLHRYSQSSERESLNLTLPNHARGRPSPWRLRLRFEGQSYRFDLDAAEVMALRRDALVAPYVKALFSPSME